MHKKRPAPEHQISAKNEGPKRISSVRFQGSSAEKNYLLRCSTRSRTKLNHAEIALCVAREVPGHPSQPIFARLAAIPDRPPIPAGRPMFLQLKWRSKERPRLPFWSFSTPEASAFTRILCISMSNGYCGRVGKNEARKSEKLCIPRPWTCSCRPGPTRKLRKGRLCG